MGMGKFDDIVSGLEFERNEPIFRNPSTYTLSERVILKALIEASHIDPMVSWELVFYIIENLLADKESKMIALNMTDEEFSNSFKEAMEEFGAGK